MPICMYGCDPIGPIDLSPLEEKIYEIICRNRIRSGRRGITEINKRLKTRIHIIENALDSLTLKSLITVSAGFWCRKEVVIYKEIIYPAEHQEEVVCIQNNDYGLQIFGRESFHLSRGK